MPDLKSFIKSKPMNWLCRTLEGNICLFWILTSLPAFIAFLRLSYVQRILTVDRALYIAFVCTVEGCVAGLLIWLIVTRPALNRAGSNRKPDQ